MQNAEDEEVLLLRINALKTTSRVNKRKVSDATSSIDGKYFCAAALDSSKISSVSDSENERKSNLQAVKHNAKEQPSTTADSHELILRQQALKSLLKKRVVKTSELIKKNAEVVHKQKSSLIPLQVPARLQIKVTNNLSTKTKLLTEVPTVSLNPNSQISTKDAPPKFLKCVSIGDDDEVSLCASDHDENGNEVSDNISESSHTHSQSIAENGRFDSKNSSGSPQLFSDSKLGNLNDALYFRETKLVQSTHSLDNNDIQCSVVSCSQIDSTIQLIYEKENHFTEQPVSTISKQKVMTETTEEITSQITTIISDEYKFSSSTRNETPLNIGLYSRLHTSTQQKSDIDDTSGQNLNDVPAIEDQCEPGPSGYVKFRDSDSDLSVTEITPPKMSIPLIIELSDSDDCSTNNSSKGKCKKRKKKTLNEMLSEKVGIDCSRDDLKDLSCSICLCSFENRSFLDKCFHSFCYICIIQWAELSRLCPLCKTKYDALIHSVTKDLEYQQFVFPKEDAKSEQRDFNEIMPDGRRFRYRSTVVDTETWAARRAERERLEGERISNRDQRKMSRRLKWSATKDRRKAVYGMNMILKEIKQRGKAKKRDISPTFFTDNPAMKHRLVPWLLRDLNVLLGDDDDSIRFVMSLILNIISKTPMDSEEFTKQLKPFLFKETDHFITELMSFASSPYDIKGYDDNVVYDVPQQCEDKSVETINIPDTFNDPIREKLLHEVFIGNEDNETILDQVNDNISLTSDTLQIEQKEVLKNAESNTDIDIRVSSEVSDKSFEQGDSEEYLETYAAKKKSKQKKSKKKKKKRKKIKCVKDDEYETDENSNEEDTDKDYTKKTDKELKKGKSKESKNSREDDETSKSLHSESISRKEVSEQDKDQKSPDRHCDNSDKHHSYHPVDEEQKKTKKRKKSRKEDKHKKKRKTQSTDSPPDSSKLIKLKEVSSEDDINRKKPSKKSQDVRKRGRSKESSPRRRKDSKKYKKRHKDLSRDRASRERSLDKAYKPAKTDHQENRKIEKRESEFELVKIDEIRHKKHSQHKRKKKHKHKHGKRNKREKRSSSSSDIDSKRTNENKTNNSNTSSEVEDELNIERLQEYLKSFTENRKIDLIKDGDSYKTRAEVVHELLMIEKAILKRKEDKQKLKVITQGKENLDAIHQNTQSTQAIGDSIVPNLKANVDDAVELAMNTLSKKEKKKVERVEREKSYLILIQELQQIDQTLNTYHS